MTKRLIRFFPVESSRIPYILFGVLMIANSILCMTSNSWSAYTSSRSYFELVLCQTDDSMNQLFQFSYLAALVYFQLGHATNWQCYASIRYPSRWHWLMRYIGIVLNTTLAFELIIFVTPLFMAFSTHLSFANEWSAMSNYVPIDHLTPLSATLLSAALSGMRFFSQGLAVLLFNLLFTKLAIGAASILLISCVIEARIFNFFPHFPPYLIPLYHSTLRGIQNTPFESNRLSYTTSFIVLLAIVVLMIGGLFVVIARYDFFSKKSR